MKDRCLPKELMRKREPGGLIRWKDDGQTR